MTLSSLKSSLSRHRHLSIGVVAAATLVLLWTVIPIPATWIESLYSLHVFRWIGSVLVPVTSLVPFSLSFLALVSGAALFGYLWGRNWRRCYRERQAHRPGMLWGLKRLAILFLFGYLAFLLVWGAGYRRVPLAQRLDLDGDPVSAEELTRCAEELLEALERLIPTVDDRDVGRALLAISEVLADRVETWDGAAVSVPSRVKILPAGTLLIFGTSGVTSPFLLEAHVDGGLHAVDQVRVAAHELAHAAGYCTEAEADLASYLVGLGTDNAFARYCVTLAVFVDIVRQLEREPRERLLAALPEIAVKDLLEAREARSRYGVRWLSKLQSLLYDSYLKSQGVEEGIRNYSTGVRHFALAWRKGLVRLK
jgi:hypothetical protein